MTSSSRIGHTISQRYTIHEQIGKGGFAQVFRALDNHTQQIVALKILHPPQKTETDGKIAERFLREAAVQQKLSHPNLLSILDVASDGDTSYIVMELLEGHDLRQQLENKGPLSPEEAIPLFIQALEAIHVAHQEDIIHRDLKPENLFILFPESPMPRMKVLDFGIARINLEQTITLTGQMLGTNKYLAPEYIQDNIASPALDIYQIGLVLVEALKGSPVINTQNAIVGMRQHLRGDIPIPRKLLESSLGPILMRALALNHLNRYQTAQAFADDLRCIDPEIIPSGSSLYDCIELSTFSKLESLDLSSSEEEAIPTRNSPKTPRQKSKSIAIILGVFIGIICISIGIFFSMQ